AGHLGVRNRPSGTFDRSLYRGRLLQAKRRENGAECAQRALKREIAAQFEAARPGVGQATADWENVADARRDLAEVRADARLENELEARGRGSAHLGRELDRVDGVPRQPAVERGEHPRPRQELVADAAGGHAAQRQRLELVRAVRVIDVGELSADLDAGHDLRGCAQAQRFALVVEADTDDQRQAMWSEQLTIAVARRGVGHRVELRALDAI